MRKAASLIRTSEIKILLNLPANILVLIFVKCEDTDHANVLFRTGPRATYLPLRATLCPWAPRW